MENALSRGLSQLGLSLDQATQEKLCAFGQAVIEQNKVMNLTAITEPAQVAILHLADCVSLLKVADLKGKKLIDVGCGAGFPGVPLKIACPETELTLLDSLGKRMHWLEEILPTLGVEASYIIGRAEEALEGRREQYDFATSRAVARLNILLELTAPYVKVGGKVLAMKGAAAEEELLEAKGAIKKLGLQLEGVHTFPLDGTAHNVMVFRKVSSTPSQYPRRYSKIKQSPL
jgi:16S rRNA (guanine527-N7)-methyltransferase